MAQPLTTIDDLAEWLNRAATVKAQRLGARLTAWFERATTETASRLVSSPRRAYAISHWIASGDVAELHAAVGDKTRYILKIGRSCSAGALLAAEHRVLKTLADLSGESTYREYIPSPVESFVATGEFAGHRINVFHHRDGLYALAAIRERYPQGLDARHLAWLFKRMLVVAGFAQQGGVVHGAILPPHLLVDAENHGLQLVDWIGAVKVGQRLRFVPTRYRDWYPPEALNREPATSATDLYLAAKCLLYAAGGDPIAHRWPDAVPRDMRQFVNTCLYSSPRMRPQNAWQLHEEFDELLRQLFGPPQFHTLAMA